jgi:hypothetical protein
LEWFNPNCQLSERKREAAQCRPANNDLSAARLKLGVVDQQMGVNEWAFFATHDNALRWRNLR